MSEWLPRGMIIAALAQAGIVATTAPPAPERKVERGEVERIAAANKRARKNSRRAAK